MSRSRKAAAATEDVGDIEEFEDAEEETPANKRQRTSGTVYPKGTVKQVKVFNFMTYGEPAVTITPGPRLNLVLGPNGTGKSSLVCALCVGLAGSTKLLGRADNIKEYIRRGCDRGWVETTLSGGPGSRDHVVRCDLIKAADSYKTEWKLNRASCTKKDIQELVESLNIQFDNLCQFLPQDKVVEFARMDQYESLVATEKAIGDASLYETHQELIAKRNLAKEKESVLAATERQHQQLSGENQQLERDYERFRRRKNMQEEIELMKKKVVWMRVKEAQDKASEAASAQREAEQELKKAQQEAKSDERPAQRRQKEAADAKRVADELVAKVRKCQHEAQTAYNNLEGLETDVRDVREKLNGLQAESDKDAADREVARTKIEKAQTQLANFPPIPDHTPRQAELAQQMQVVREQVANLEAEKAELTDNTHAAKREVSRLEAQLRECDSAKYQRLQGLMRRNGMVGLPEAINWVNQLRQEGKFRGEVAGPMGLEIKVKLARNAHYLEQATYGQLCNFAVQHKEDADILINKFKQMQLRCNVITIRDDISQQFHSKTAHLKEHGVVCSLDEVYDAPPLVRHCLANMCNLPNVYVVDHDDTDRVGQLMDGHGIRQVYTKERLLTFVASAYGSREDSGLQTATLNAAAGQILGSGAGADVEERKSQLQRQLQQTSQHLAHLEQQYAAKEGEVQPLDQKLVELQAESRHLAQEVQQARHRRSNLQTQLKNAQAYLSKLEQKPDPLDKGPALQQQLARALSAHYNMLCKHLAAIEAQWDYLEKHAAAELTFRELDMQAKGLAAAVAARRAAVQARETAVRAAQQRARNATQAYLKAKSDAEQEHPLEGNALERFREMPENREDLEEKIQSMQEEVAGIAVNNPRVVEEYRKRQHEIQKLSDELQSLNSTLAAAREEMETLKECWQPELERVIALINSSFSRNFAQIGCTGEVLLGTSEDYDKFSIKIKVKFRESEDLELLTAHRQSGGERSVSTILYLIALQGVTVTPFRVVDEINQGMDPINERKVFKQLVEASCQEGTPQCFLLTPKLLPDLPFTEDITVLNIFNGGMIAEQVAGQYSSEALFGTRNMAVLQRVPVAG